MARLDDATSELQGRLLSDRDIEEVTIESSNGTIVQLMGRADFSTLSDEEEAEFKQRMRDMVSDEDSTGGWSFVRLEHNPRRGHFALFER